MELLETSAAFKHGSRHSLLLLDELGRGTATHDGASIAYAVLNRLVGHEMRTLFSTHYHELASDVRDVFLGKKLLVDSPYVPKYALSIFQNFFSFLLLICITEDCILLHRRPH